MISEQSPFPALTYQSDALKGADFFASWQDFEVNNEILDGELPITIGFENPDDRAPSPAQINAYRYLKENEAQVTDAILGGLLADYPQIREVYDGIEPEFLPEIEQPEDFRRLIRPIRVHVNYESKDEYAYVGFEFDCLWDIEHGLGVMTHQGEYIGCNDAEAAWNLDLARS